MDATLPVAGCAPLSVEERRALLWLARQSIRAILEADDAPKLTQATPALVAPAAAFVSLYTNGELRGCVGTLSADTPLHDTVVRVACSAAFGDPRFTSLRASDLPSLAIEISRLGPLVPATATQIEIGVHGVSLDCQGGQAVFLPKVAAEHGWDREMLLSALCRKAMLPADAWQRPDTELFVFTAEVFGDDAKS